ncbi:pimeloyl-ACP methyl ester carboxylesterase [Sphingomonas sp. UYAg733]
MTIVIGIAAVMAALIVTGLVYSMLRARQVERLVPPLGHFFEIDGKRLHYTDAGSGGAVVLIHGLAGNGRNFGYALTDLLAAHHRVVTVDRPGSGHSDGIAGNFSLPTQARMIAGLIDHLALDKPLVVGHSLGGAVALALAVLHPDKLRGVALLSALTRVIDTPPAAFRTLQIRSTTVRHFIASAIAVPMSAINSAKSAHAVFAPEPAPADFAIRGGGLLVQRPGAIFTASTELTQAPEQLAPIVARYGEIVMPVSILYGRSDEILDPMLHGETLPMLIPHARTALIDGGHMIPITAAATVAKWIQQCAAPA